MVIKQDCKRCLVGLQKGYKSIELTKVIGNEPKAFLNPSFLIINGHGIMQYTHGNYINYKNLYPLLISRLQNRFTELLRRLTEFSRNFCESSGTCKATPPKPKNYLH